MGAATRPADLPAPGWPELAVAGRSNAGKSSLVNCLAGRRGLARTSATPGRTRQANLFLLNETVSLVDLPGHGFAVGPASEREAWGALVETYVRERPTLRALVLALDVRRVLEADEEWLLAVAAARRLPVVVAATKVDKLGRGAVKTTLAGLGRALAGRAVVVGVSTRTGVGRDALWRVLDARLRVPVAATRPRG